MKPQDLLDARRAALGATLTASVGDKPHLDAFAARLLGPDRATSLLPDFRFACPDGPETLRYEGFPRVAHIGFGLGAGAMDPSAAAETFLTGIRRLKQRQGQMLLSLASDDVALLGLCEGVAHLRAISCDVPGAVIDWLVELVDGSRDRGYWLARARGLAGDLLDGRGRIRTAPAHVGTDAEALEVALRATWPAPYTAVAGLDDEGRSALLTSLLSEPLPRAGDLARVAVWLRALDALVAFAARSLTPSVSDIVRILQDIQHSLKRWRSSGRGRRKDLPNGLWLIDDEYDVQTLLWAVLYPIFRSDLVDERYLPNWGLTQPRLDLGIESLGVIIEAKIVRIQSDWGKIEGEIGNDTGLYFRDPSKFNRMVVFIYDDCDLHEPEKVAGLRNALMKRERVEGVVVIRRPSVMPNRNQRG